MIKSIIIGAGELGSRHLQGMLKFVKQQEIYVVDISEPALETARLRADEIDHSHHILFVKDFHGLPEHFQFAIISSGANVRELLVNKLLGHSTVDYLILEKVLFQEISSYERIETLFSQINQKVWVNHPRRMFSHYQNVKNKVQNNGNPPLVLNCFGGNWGLGCNALHFLDLFCFVADSPLESLDFSYLDQEIMDSKRIGNVEFSGTINGRLKNGSVLQLSSFAGDRTAITVSVMSANDRFIIQEGGTPQILTFEKDNRYSIVSEKIEPLYQSKLTTLLMENLFSTHTCNLPFYSEARITHEIFINGLLKKYNSITALNTEICPIT